MAYIHCDEQHYRLFISTLHAISISYATLNFAESKHTKLGQKLMITIALLLLSEYKAHIREQLARFVAVCFRREWIQSFCEKGKTYFHTLHKQRWKFPFNGVKIPL